MKLPTYKEAFTSVFMFALGIIVMSGLSYLFAQTTPPNNPPQENLFKPINEGSETQARCKAENTKLAIDLNHIYDVSPYDQYNGCVDGIPLITNGLFIKQKNTTFLIDGDPKASDSRYRAGALYVGCSNDRTRFGDLIDGCKGSSLTKPIEPEAYFNGDIYLYDLADPTATGDRRLCLSTKGEVVICEE